MSRTRYLVSQSSYLAGITLTAGTAGRIRFERDNPSTLAPGDADFSSRLSGVHLDRFGVLFVVLLVVVAVLVAVAETELLSFPRGLLADTRGPSAGARGSPLDEDRPDEPDPARCLADVLCPRLIKVNSPLVLPPVAATVTGDLAMRRSNGGEYWVPASIVCRKVAGRWIGGLGRC